MRKNSKGIGGHQSARMGNDEWLTPLPLIKPLGVFDLDPCSPIERPWDTALHHYHKLDDGLKQDWWGRVWMNPPYGREVVKWLEKLVKHGNGVAMIFARTETRHFFKYGWRAADSIFFLEGRPHFCYVDGTPAKANSGAPVCYLTYGKDNVDAMEASGLPGEHVLLKSTNIFVIGVSPAEADTSWFDVVKLAVNRHGELVDSNLTPVYELVEKIAPGKVAKNKHWKEKIRQKIQELRKKGTVRDHLTIAA